ncbi:hypothetical protein HMPREF9554_01470 [Treponema phagedenis F0421]|nr:hypothetical protein HMPREF9554_01470 [Treponema phagedenis F0421]
MNGEKLPTRFEKRCPQSKHTYCSHCPFVGGTMPVGLIMVRLSLKSVYRFF